MGLGTLGFRFKVNILYLDLSSQLIFPTHREIPCGIPRAGGAEGGLGNGTGAFIFQKDTENLLRRTRGCNTENIKGDKGMLTCLHSMLSGKIRSFYLLIRWMLGAYLFVLLKEIL